MSNDDEKRLKEMLSTGAADPAWGEELRRRYPFFAVPEGEETPGQLSALRARSPEALRAADPSALTPFYPEEERRATPDTNTAIDDFLSRYSNTSPEEEALLERMIFNPVPDYAQQLAREAETDMPEAPAADGDSPDDRINRFILADHSRHVAESPLAPEPASAPDDKTKGQAAAHPKTKVTVSAPKPSPQSSLLSESLAKIYIKSHKYERAYEILSRLSLEFPEKSRYFADQLRFLRKLIVNQRACDMTINNRKG